MKYLLFTHYDLDGSGCEILFRLYFQHKDVHVSSSSTEELNLRLERMIANRDLDPFDTTIFFTDICPECGLLEQLISLGYCCHLIDHHPTATLVEGLKRGSVLDVTDSESGTSLFHRFLEEEGNRFNVKGPKSKSLIEFVDTVRSWDTWEWVRTNNQHAKHLVTLFFMLGYDRFTDLYISRWQRDPGDKGPVIPAEHMFFVDAKLESQQKIIDEMTPAQVITRKVFGYNAAILFAGTGFTFSEGSYVFLKKYPEYDIMLNINLGRRTISYRTIRNDIDLGKLSQEVGGGGHAKAAGSSVPIDKLNDILEQILK